MAVPGEGYLGRIMPVAVEEEGEEKAQRPLGCSSSGRATALLPAPRYRRLRPTADASLSVATAGLVYAPVLLHCRWGGQPGPLAAILAPAPADYRAWRLEQAAAAARRKARAAAMQAAAEALAAVVGVVGDSKGRQVASLGGTKAGVWAPSARPPALPKGATARVSLGSVTSAGFALGDGHAVAHGVVAVEALRQMQAGAAKGVPAPMAGVVLVKDARSGVADPASLHLWC